MRDRSVERSLKNAHQIVARKDVALAGEQRLRTGRTVHTAQVVVCRNLVDGELAHMPTELAQLRLELENVSACDRQQMQDVPS